MQRQGFDEKQKKKKCGLMIILRFGTQARGLEVAQNMLRVTMGFRDPPPPHYCYACFACVTTHCYGGLDPPPPPQ